MNRILTLAIGGLGIVGAALRAEDSSVKSATPAIIVIRHAEDTENWVFEKVAAKTTTTTPPFPSIYWNEQAPDWPQYIHDYLLIDSRGSLMKSGEAFEINAHALSGDWKTAQGKDGAKMKNASSPQGESQARRLADKLDGFLQKNNFASVSRVITMDPTVESSTPNPFCTLWPYLKSKNNKTELFFVERDSSTDKSPGIMSLIDNERNDPTPSRGVPSHGGTTPIFERLLSPNGGSTIVCWTGEGMRDEDGILAKLCQNFVGQVPDWAKGNPVRCSDVTIFYRIPDGEKQMGVVEKWYFHSGSDNGGFEYTKGSTLPADAERTELK